MQEHSFLPEFDDDDVVELENGSLYKIGALRNALNKFVLSKQIANLLYDLLKGFNITISNPNNWFSSRVNSQILKSNSQGWKKGKLKLRLSLEFEPDEPEIKEPASPLDDIRQTINQ